MPMSFSKPASLSWGTFGYFFHELVWTEFHCHQPNVNKSPKLGGETIGKNSLQTPEMKPQVETQSVSPEIEGTLLFVKF